MKKTDSLYRLFLAILQQELIPATGCTEPIAIAYAAAMATKELGVRPTRVKAWLSSSIIKNAKAVTIPNTNGLKGIPAAIAAGIVAGDPRKKLEVIAHIHPEQKAEIAEYATVCPMEIQVTDSGRLFEIVLEVFAGENSASVQIANSHTNILAVRKNGCLIRGASEALDSQDELLDYSHLSVRSVLDFSDSLDPADVKDLIERQIACNTCISRKGLEGSYGANVGKTFLTMHPQDSLFAKVIAAAAAASDARMGGCNLPVFITAGSGNQGLTASLPVIEYAVLKKAPRERLCRALVLSTLITVHQKNYIGKLSAFCGAVSAGAGSAAGIAYLDGGGYTEISHTLVNALAIASGMVCDGAKPSCAAKITMAVGAGLLGYEMYMHEQQFCQGEGLVAADVEKTIANIGRLGREGMQETEREILQMMLE